MENSEDFFDFAPPNTTAQQQQQQDRIFSSDNNENSANSTEISIENQNSETTLTETNSEHMMMIKMEDTSDEKDELGPIPDTGPTFRTRCYTWPRQYLEGHLEKTQKKATCLFCFDFLFFIHNNTTTRV